MAVRDQPGTYAWRTVPPNGRMPGQPLLGELLSRSGGYVLGWRKACTCAVGLGHDGGVTGDPGVYVARYGWNRRSGSLIVGAAVFVLVALTVPMSRGLRAVTLVFFG